MKKLVCISLLLFSLSFLITNQNSVTVDQQYAEIELYAASDGNCFGSFDMLNEDLENPQIVSMTVDAGSILNENQDITLEANNAFEPCQVNYTAENNWIANTFNDNQEITMDVNCTAVYMEPCQVNNTLIASNQMNAGMLLNGDTGQKAQLFSNVVTHVKINNTMMESAFFQTTMESALNTAGQAQIYC